MSRARSNGKVWGFECSPHPFVGRVIETNLSFSSLVYADYARSNDLFAVFVYLFALLASQTANIGKQASVAFPQTVRRTQHARRRLGHMKHAN